MLGVEHLKTGQLLGHVGLSPLNDDVEVSYAIAQAWRGRGLRMPASFAACAWPAAVFDLMRILALTASANAAQRRTLASAGFVHIGDGVRSFQGRDQSSCDHKCPSCGTAKPVHDTHDVPYTYKGKSTMRPR